MRTVFLAGAPRSGSTLLGMLLGSHPQVENLGETRMLEQCRAADRPCGCGTPLRHCDFWNGAGPTTPVVVDTSKDAAYIAGRISEGDVVVHLIRDPRALVVSRWRGWATKRSEGRPTVWETIRVSASWSVRNLRAARLTRRERGLTVSYERFVRAPEVTCEKILHRVGITGPLGDIDVQHAVAGNGPVKRAAGAPIRLDEVWREVLPRPLQWTAWVVGLPLSLRYRP